jgi:hypothetical protein
MEPPQLAKAESMAFSSIMAEEAPASVSRFFTYPAVSIFRREKFRPALL